MDAVDFLHHENSPTWAGVEPANFSIQGQHLTKHSNHPAQKRAAVASGYGSEEGDSSHHMYRGQSFPVGVVW
ncbi:hypothetical protein TNCV_4276961 [Trichonephila clavipes]|nr:hypothetical protein TNCV_4276961 [Trichonephila clavipes]